MVSKNSIPRFNPISNNRSSTHIPDTGVSRAFQKKSVPSIHFPGQLGKISTGQVTYWIKKYFPAKIDMDFDHTDPSTIETPVLGRIFGTIELFHRQIARLICFCLYPFSCQYTSPPYHKAHPYNLRKYRD